RYRLPNELQLSVARIGFGSPSQLEERRRAVEIQMLEAQVEQLRRQINREIPEVAEQIEASPVIKSALRQLRDNPLQLVDFEIRATRIDRPLPDKQRQRDRGET